MTQVQSTENFNEFMKSLSKEQVKAGRRFQWEAILARETQLPDDSDWVTWLFLAGRGTGKTRTAAEYLAWQAIINPETRWAIVAPTHADARDTCVEGQ